MILLVALQPGSPGWAQTFYVDVSNMGVEDGSLANPFNTIQEALTLAVRGDTVVVAAGTYPESIVIPPGVVVEGAGRDVTTIDATGLGTSTVRMVGFSRLPRATLRGFTVTGGVGSDLFSDPNVPDPIFNANAIGGGGILLQGDGLVEDNRIDGNHLQGTRPNFLGGGIYTVEGNPIITNNIISGNTANQTNPGAPYSKNYSIGGGILVGFFSTPFITQNTISGNTANATFADDYSQGIAGGIGVYAGSYPTTRIDWNLIADNSSTDFAGGINVGTTLTGPSESVITNNIIVGNSCVRSDIYYTDGYGGGAYLYYSNVQFTNNTVVGNTSDFGAGIMLGYSYPSVENPFALSEIVVTNNLITSNHALGSGGGVYIEEDVLVFSNNNVFGNTGIDQTTMGVVPDEYAPTIQDRTGLNGNISADPLYVDEVLRDFHVMAGSPVIDTGTNTDAPSLDFDFINRPIDGDADMAAITDIGAFEYFVMGADSDMDGIPDEIDNCPATANPLQEDGDSDDVGDACDNCLTGFNPDQGDADRDGLPDLCDNCRGFFNPSQADLENDGVGNECDNCFTQFNPAQEDEDFDKVGDACDNCLALRNTSQLDTDKDGMGNVCDLDDDGDGVPDVADCAEDDLSASALPMALPPTMTVTLDGLTARLDWDPIDKVQVYDVYRGDHPLQGPVFNYNHDCLVAGLLQTEYDDPDLPPSNVGYYYLPVARNACGGGSLGTDTAMPVANERPRFLGQFCAREPGYNLFLSSSGAVSVRFNRDQSKRLDSVFRYPDRANPWFHVAATYDGAVIRMYIDGVEDATLATTFFLGENDAPLTIGADVTGKSLMRGMLEEVKIFDRALSPGEILDLANIIQVPGGLRGSWRMNEGSGLVILDDSGNQNEGQLQGNPFWQVGLEGQALDLDGVDDFAIVQDSPSLDVTGQITLAAWVNSETQASQRILRKVGFPDADGDGVRDVSDGCPFLFNPSQADTDLDGVGSVCDNCPHAANSNQLNTDGDEWGDACDGDQDNDGIPNGIDPNPLIPDGPVLPNEIGRSLVFSDLVTLIWGPGQAPTGYNLYRTVVPPGQAFAYDYNCDQSGLASPTAVPTPDPTLDGEVFAYVVTVTSATGESSPGQSSAGVIRPLTTVCP